MDFLILGKAQAKQRPKFGNGHAYTPKKTANYEAYVKSQAIEQMKQQHAVKYADDVPLSMTIEQYVIPPKSLLSVKSRYADNLKAMHKGTLRPTKKPDLDNIAKSICDALNGIAYHDDKQIVELVVRKFYGSSDMVRIS